MEDKGLQGIQNGERVKGRIVVIDDEEGVLDSVSGVLSDEGYLVCCFKDPHKGYQFIKEQFAGGNKINLVLVDIWMPGLDGFELLQALKKDYPSLPVVLISGHATVSTAVEATKAGAVDLLEKPLELNRFLEVIGNILSLKDSHKEVKDESSWSRGDVSIELDALSLFKESFFKDQQWKGREVCQKTLARSAVIYGRGLHTGKKTGLILQPLEPNSGIFFTVPFSNEAVPAYLPYVVSTGFATTIAKRGIKVSTIEHLMSALHAYGITNLLIKCDSEVPVLDGSALEFCRVIEEAGVVEQGGGLFELAVPEEIKVGNKDEFISIKPSDRFIVNYTLSYPKPVGEQRFKFILNSPDDFKRDIAPARTFGFVEDIEQLQKKGLAQGGRFDNFLLIGDQGAINDNQRFDNELVRHKILDCIGDLYLLGRPIIGEVTAYKTGHSENIQLLREIFNKMNLIADKNGLKAV